MHRNLTKQNIPKKLQEWLKTKENLFISNGWIDSHIHISKKAKYNLSTENIKTLKGLVAVIEAGSFGPKNITSGIKENINLPFKVFYLLNVSSYGLNCKDELNGKKLDENNFIKAQDKIAVVGSKIRLSHQAIGKDEQTYLDAINIAKKINKPIMYHIGNEPPPFCVLLNYLRDIDVITHIYHGKNNNILDSLLNNLICDNVQSDVGFGNASFNFDMLFKISALGYRPSIISTDLHDESFKNSSCRLEKIMSIFMEVGLGIDEVINAITIVPFEKYIGKKRYPTYLNTFTIFKIVDINEEVIDSIGNKMMIHKKIIPIAKYVNEEVVEC